MAKTDPLLLTPGPLTTSLKTKEAMVRDMGSRDDAFIAINKSFQDTILDIARAKGTHVCVPLQGSGTFIVEATLGTLIPKTGKALVLINGAYGHRMVKILKTMGRTVESLEWDEDIPVDAAELDRTLTNDPSITHVAVVHCETTSGILNPIEQIADIAASRNRSFLIDAMSAFGALDIDATKVPFDALMASSNKCLEGVPGVGFSIIRQSVLEQAEGNAHSLSLDLFDQWQTMQKNGQWRFTPPIQVIRAFSAALEQFKDEGGVVGRYRRYQENCRILVDGMRKLGFKTLLSDNLQAPIIVTFLIPKDGSFDFQVFYDELKDKGFVIYPGKLTKVPSFRIGCIGHLSASDMQAALTASKQTITP